MISKFISTQTLIAIHIGTFGIFYGTYPSDLRFWSQLKKGDCEDVVSPKQKYIFFCVYGPNTLLLVFQKHCYGNPYNVKQ